MTQPPRRSHLLPFVLFGATVALGACGPKRPATDVSEVVRQSTRDQLVRFESAEELRDYGRRLVDARREQAQAEDDDGGGDYSYGAEPSAAAPAPPAQAEESGAVAKEAADESVTNVQEAGVDEGGIVKTHGDHLVVLRRGRLFSVDLSAGDMHPVSMVNAYPSTEEDTWYDEMLVQGDTIVVVGYSYGASATEIGVFDIDAGGHIRRRGTHYLRSNDYYSSRNYASRLIGNKLVFYMPYSLLDYGSDTMSLPAVRPQGSTRWRDITLPTEIYRPIQPTEAPVLHTVVTCDLSSADLGCRARGVIGPYGRNFYVSPRAVYVWVSGGHSSELDRQHVEQAPGVVYRLPLDDGAPGALKVWGVPTDQFSFKELEGRLHVVVRSEGGGDWMWSAETTAGEVALMSVPVAAINAQAATVREDAYTRLPRPGEGYEFQNRFVGDQLLYGSGNGWGYAEAGRGSRIFVHPFRRGGTTTSIPLPHGVDRIESLGRHAVVVGSDGTNLHFSALDLNATPKIAGRFVQPRASQGELRSHGFFFKPSGDRDGMLGLPVRGEGEPGAAHLEHGSASVMFLRVADLRFAPLGRLAAQANEGEDDDQCEMSCVDWYGNARPLFYRGRVFALLGYELVEGRMVEGRIEETARRHMLRDLPGRKPAQIAAPEASLGLGSPATAATAAL